MLIKFRLLYGCIFVAMLLSFSSCGIVGNKKPIYEIDLKQKTEVQLTYNRNVYNTLICYKDGCLVFEFSDKGDSYDGLVFTVTKDFCSTSFKGAEYDFSTGTLTDSLFVNEMFSFISSFQGVIITENFNEVSGCSYVTRRQGTHTFTFEVFENNGNRAYSLKIV